MNSDAFWALDYDKDGFFWLDCHSESKCLYAIFRRGEKDSVAALFNFGAVDYKYEVKLPKKYKAEILINSEWEPFSGKIPVETDTVKIKGQELIADLPRFSGMIIQLK